MSGNQTTKLLVGGAIGVAVPLVAYWLWNHRQQQTSSDTSASPKTESKAIAPPAATASQAPTPTKTQQTTSSTKPQASSTRSSQSQTTVSEPQSVSSVSAKPITQTVSAAEACRQAPPPSVPAPVSTQSSNNPANPSSQPSSAPPATKKAANTDIPKQGAASSQQSSGSSSTTSVTPSAASNPSPPKKTAATDAPKQSVASESEIKTVASAAISSDWAQLEERQKALIRNLHTLESRIQAVQSTHNRAVRAENIRKGRVANTEKIMGLSGNGKKAKVPGQLPDVFLLDVIGRIEKGDLTPNDPPYPMTRSMILMVISGIHRLESRTKLSYKPEQFKELSQKLWFVLCRVDMTPPQVAQAWKENEDMKWIEQNLDRASGLQFRREPYVPGAPDSLNLVKSPDVLALMEKFYQIQKREWFEESKNPMDNLKLSVDFAQLQGRKRAKCPQCGKSGYLYCSDCLLAVGLNDIALPQVRLPIDMDVLLHPAEKKTKATSVHGCIFSPDIHLIDTTAGIPEYDPATTAVLFPSPDAEFVDEMDWTGIKKILVIEATWQTANSIATHPHVKNARKCKIHNRITTYWRYQELGHECLATLEAMYYFFVDHFTASVRHKHPLPHPITGASPDAYDGRYDDLMLFYAFQLHTMQGRFAAAAKEEMSNESLTKQTGGVRTPKIWCTYTKKSIEMKK